MARSPRPSSPRTRAAGALVLVTVLAVLAGLALLVVGGQGLPWRPRRGGDTATSPGAAVVVRVVDGDTLVAEVGGREERVRLIGIDTPETVAPNRPVECYGAEASHRLNELLPVGTTIRLERDLEPRDTYDRLLAYVFRADDGLFVNLAQVGGGFAEATEYPPNVAHRPELDEAERAAREAGTGLWRACGGADTPATPGPARPPAAGGAGDAGR
jgi:micrococcal nuclease